MKSKEERGRSHVEISSPFTQLVENLDDSCTTDKQQTKETKISGKGCKEYSNETPRGIDNKRNREEPRETVTSNI